jgi:Uri superfamily endonuclease
MKGIYALLMKVSNDSMISIGKLGELKFKAGHYIYIGSAQNGLEARINRHVREQKKLFWHIDYLLQSAQITDIYYNERKKEEECSLANNFSKELIAINGFGASDCNCISHLFFSPEHEKIFEHIEKLDLMTYE